MLKSLVLPNSAVYFPQLAGPCYHYTPITAALLYEVSPIFHRGATKSGPTIAKQNAKMWMDLAHRCRLAVVMHKTPYTVNSGMYMPDEMGKPDWWHLAEEPWPGLPKTAAIVLIRHLPCPLRAYVQDAALSGKRIVDINHREFVLYLGEWVQSQPYYFPALRQAELAAVRLATAIRDSQPYLTTESLPSLACWVQMKEVGNSRALSPDLFDRDGNTVPSKTRMNPVVTVMRENMGKRGHVDRANIVYELFTNGESWDGHRTTPILANDRIENITGRAFRPKHPIPFVQSQQTHDVVFRYDQQLPTSLHFTRGWRYGIERLAFDVDATP